ncbi:DNA primase [Marivibrio halodurans]|uniref:DNA primase n=1 Tax=Marivibrio halodurans TaxID=2039722 RepID=A0A8J7RZF7_9PROT|nr:DNA primase [Marivibrio halodurans]MBP5857405.1 DNA primase [Marivibrio halodurans]
MAFPPGFLDDIRARISLVGLVGRRVQLKQKGRGDWWGISPFTNEKTPSFHVVEDKGFFHCFSTGEHGDHFSWLMKTEGLEFPEAVERLAGEAGLEMPRRTPEDRKQAERRKSLHDVMTFAVAWYERQLRKPAGRDAHDYLKGRGLSEATIARFSLGFAPDDREGLAGAAKAEGIEMEALIEVGLYRKAESGRPPYPLFRERVMFPIADTRGRWIAFGGRFMGDAKARGIGKYINSPDTPLFDKSRTLYHLGEARDAARRDGARLLVAEGYMDVIALAQAGFQGAVAPLGTAITEEQIALLWRVADEPVLCLDGDAAGGRAALRAAERAMPQLKPGKSLGFAFLPQGEDPDSLIANSGAPAMAGVVEAARPLFQVVWEAERDRAPFDTPERRADLENRLKQLAGQIEDETVKKQYFRAINDKLWELARRRNRPPRKAGGLSGRGPGGGRAPWRDVSRAPHAAEPLGRALSGQAGGLSRRQQQLVLLILANHPGLIEEFDEPLAAYDLDADLDKVRRALQKLAASGEPLDSRTVRDHFSQRGDRTALRLVDDANLYQLARQARPDALMDEARAALDHMLLIRTQGMVRAEMGRAGGRARGDGGDEAAAEARRLAMWRDVDAGEAALGRGVIDEDD